MSNEYDPFDTSLADRLDADVNEALTDPRGINSQYSRRVVVYTVLSAIEASTYKLKADIEHFWTAGFSPTTPTPADLAALRDETYVLGDNGTPQVRQRWSPVAANIRFAFDSLCRMAGIPSIVDYGGKGWKDMKTAIAIRHRITHPRQGPDLEVSIEEMDTVRDAHLWFLQTRIDVVRASLEAMDRHVKKSTARKTPPRAGA